MPTHFHLMPVDRTTIETQLRIHPALFDDPDTFIRRHDLPVRAIKPGRNARGDRSLTIDHLTYKGIKICLSQTAGDPLTRATIHFNPGVCLYGHNGHILTLTEFIHALGLLVTHLKPLLHDQDDWVDIIPGVRRGSPAYWTYLEVPFHCLDPDGTLLAAFRHARHPRITTPTRHWPDSIRIGGHRSKLVLCIYLKALEMVARDKLPKRLLPVYEDVLRFEARMKEEKLIHYFGGEGNVALIDGVDRLTRFYPQTLIAGLGECLGELLGVYSSDKASSVVTGKPLDSLGRLLATVALDDRSTHTFPQLLASVEFYTGASSDTVSKIRKAGQAELSRRSSISSESLFSDEAWHRQVGIASREREARICHEIEDTFVHRLIYAAYQPPGMPFTPVTTIPAYHRI